MHDIQRVRFCVSTSSSSLCIFFFRLLAYSSPPSSLSFSYFCFYFCWWCSTSHCACLQTLLCCHGDSFQMASVKARLGSAYTPITACTHSHWHTQAHSWLVYICPHWEQTETLAEYILFNTYILLICWWKYTLPITHTHQHSIIKPLSAPHRKQSPLYATRMSLIFAEVNKCTCMEGIFHSGDSVQWGHCGIASHSAFRFFWLSYAVGYVSCLRWMFLCRGDPWNMEQNQHSRCLVVSATRNHRFFWMNAISHFAKCMLVAISQCWN